VAVVGEVQVLEIVSLVIVVVDDEISCMVVVVVIVKRIMICIWTIFLLPGLLSKAMSNRA